MVVLGCSCIVWISIYWNACWIKFCDKKLVKNGFIDNKFVILQPIKMSEKHTRAPLSDEHKEKMQAAAKAARDKRKAEEDANPELKEKRLAESKAKREAKKVVKTTDEESGTAESSAAPPQDKPKKERKQLSPEAQAAAIAKRKATIALKKLSLETIKEETT